ncbi:MAG: Rrf2 family transcriptional regulator [Bdellovibrionaceae bacterium]|nr:Rrf2 family transcriptional regulator [Pseudobdellovibrionaceae bacterium]
MIKVQRKIEYALMALKVMSLKRPGELTSAKEVADSVHAPFDVMARVLQLLAQKSILRAEQGAQGGYQITRDLSKVTMHDLVTLLQGPVEIAKCLQKNEACEIQGSCNIMSPIQNLNQKLNEFYRALSVQDVLFQRVEKTTLGAVTHV